MPNLFDQLRQSAVPPPPRQLDRQVHRRLNQRLVWLHTVDFAFRTIPFALYHFAAAVGGLVWYSISGNFPPAPQKPRDENDSAGD